MTHSTFKHQLGDHYSPNVIVVPLRAALKQGSKNVVDVLVRIQAPDASTSAAQSRSPQALALVIDRSGSMGGHPLDEAKRCAKFVVSRMRPNDIISLVQFDHQVKLTWPATSVGDGNALRDAISSIKEGGSTNLHGGWLKGVQTLRDIESLPFRRAILLSDGRANQGITDADEIKRQCAWWATRGITTSTCGLGHRFNEELMIEMAREGGGNSYYAESGNDLMDSFVQELDLLANLAIRNVRISASAPDGVKVEMVNDLLLKGHRWQLPDIAWGAEAWALLRLTIPKEMVPPNGVNYETLRLKVMGESFDGEPFKIDGSRLVLPVLASEAWSQIEEDELVIRRSVEIDAGRALMNLRSLAACGDWTGVDQLVIHAQAVFQGNAWVEEILKAMVDIAASRSRDRMMKEAMYSSSRLRSRLAAKREDELTKESEQDPAYLRRKSLQGRGGH